MDRRVFLSKTIIMSATVSGLGGFLLSLSSCKKEPISLELHDSVENKLLAHVRKREDLFSFFYSERKLNPDRFMTSFSEVKNALKEFNAASFVLTTNFNPFDPVFDKLKLKKELGSLHYSMKVFNFPDYPNHDFYIKKVNVRSNIRVPKNTSNFYIVDEYFVNEMLGKFKF